ncbi:MAG: hypothetical protein ACKOX6_15015 [Bdellovibrio sp.]
MSLKVSPLEINEDLCKTSIDILIEKCTEWFHQKQIDGPLWFADSAQVFPHQSENPVNIVLFGGFMKRYLESGNWFFANARIWVLSASVQKVLSQLLGVDPIHIGIIPRYELFPKTSSNLPFPRIDKLATFVFAGRISSVKNIKMLLETVSALQADNRMVHLVLIGAYDNQTHYDHGRFDLVNYQNEIEQLIQRLPWQTPPVVKPKTASNQWHLDEIINPIYVNFSTFMCEDFDVSTAQVQSLGWPCLLTDWGGHQEVTGDNVLKIPPSSVAHDHEPDPVRQIKAKALAKSLTQLRPQQHSTTNDRTAATLPKPISQEDLDVCRRRFISRNKEHISCAYREGLDSFADTPTGKRFFASYRALFSGPSESNSSICILINDLHKSKNPYLAEAFSVCEKILSRFEIRPLKFISLRDLFAADSLKKIAASNLFIVPFMSEEIAPILSHFITHLNPEKMIVVSRENLFTEDSIRKLLPLRSNDLTLLYSNADDLGEVLLANA